MIQIPLTTKRYHKTFNLACEWTKDEIFASKGEGGGEGAHTGHNEVRHCQIQQDIVEVGPELLVLSSAGNCKHIDGSAHSKYKKHVYRHCIEGA